ncbi:MULTISPECIES: MFS transporter [Rhizobium]|uniref:MFS transporter n=1 Tax=Rhizobium tropici TaxID=398 RepID=A0A6P1CAQ8_RHITR|nr:MULTISPECIES: MFS transporter [Rhizobium]AGB75502.1 major facilitator superfamily (MFS) transporter [Rhizobium tropici CIAT 899]MBB4241874.1 putative MFS transporter [Rhizobium tropici]MBB5593479.1 putative MFS transporter [Rhizobium tropici]MBB6492199.1 putative MFS transporter [Rhizobium tropici]NEV13521.1 MFS transporter [Rhizobium tropici]
MQTPITVEQGLRAAGVGSFQKRLFIIFGLVWAADAMQVLAIGFTAPSIAASFGVTVPQALQTGTFFFLGMLVGAFTFGRLADRIGRRPVLFIAIILDAICGVASAFAPDLHWLLVARFLTGLGVGGTLPVDYAMMAEFLPSDRRGRWLVLLEGFWAVGTVALALLALVAGSQGGEPWRTIFFVTGLPALVGVVLRFYVPESPLYLNQQGKSEEARKVLQRVAATNGNVVEIAPLTPQVPQRKSIAALLSPELRRRTIFLMLAWMLISVSYYGVFVYLPVRLAGEGFGFMRGQLFLLVLAIAQLPGYALAAYGVEKWGRKPTLIGFLILSAIGTLGYGLGQSVEIVISATLLLSFALLGTWGAIYAFTPEIYPTTLRASGMGLSGSVARFGGLLAPSIVAPVMTSNFGLALGVISGLLLLAAVSVAFINAESRNMALE